MNQTFDIQDATIVVTGGYGVLGGHLAVALAAAGARVAVLGRNRDAAAAKVAEIRGGGGEARVLLADVTDETELRDARAELEASWGPADALVNAAGGNVARARSDDRSVFEVPADAFDEVLRLNLHGTVLPSMVFGQAMAERGSGSIVNVSSMASMRVLTGVMGYSVAKAGIDAFTRWLAVDVARRHGPGIRVNAVAPGFFITKQNRQVLVGADGEPTERAKRILANTPMGRFGEPDELVGAVHWLCSASSSFVTGVVVPVDGGFSVFGGV